MRRCMARGARPSSIGVRTDIARRGASRLPPRAGVSVNVMRPGGKGLLGAGALALALAVLAALSSAVASAAGLDPGFATAGRLAFPLSFEGGARYRPTPLALAGDGSLYASNGTVVRLVDPDGALDPDLGDSGTLMPAAAPGGRFEIEGLAVDSLGRLVVAGTSVGSGEEFEAPIVLTGAFGPLAARVARYLPGGSVDQGFGSGGAFESDLGLPPPSEEKGRQLLGRSWVEASGVAVDDRDRILLTGGASAGSAYGCAHDWFWNTLTDAAFLARLTEAGALDPSFGAGGVFGGRSTAENPLRLEAAGRPAVGPGGEIIYGMDSGFHCQIQIGTEGVAELSDDGRTRAAFGPGGSVAAAVLASAFAPDGSVVLLERLPRGAHRYRITRLGTDGISDPAFGKDGRVFVTTPGKGPQSAFTSIATDGRGGVLLAGLVDGSRRGGQQATRVRSSWVLVALRPDGRIKRSLGGRGRIDTGFAGLSLGEPTVLVDRRGRALLVGRYHRGRQSGLAVARYLLGG